LFDAKRHRDLQSSSSTRSAFECFDANQRGNGIDGYGKVLDGIEWEMVGWWCAGKKRPCWIGNWWRGGAEVV
jgi:hypothetical protein